jgi:hypothetical protein
MRLTLDVYGVRVYRGRHQLRKKLPCQKADPQPKVSLCAAMSEMISVRVSLMAL